MFSSIFPPCFLRVFVVCSVIVFFPRAFSRFLDVYGSLCSDFKDLVLGMFF